MSATLARIKALCQLMQDGGHMTSVATRQIVRVLELEIENNKENN